MKSCEIIGIRLSRRPGSRQESIAMHDGDIQHRPITTRIIIAVLPQHFAAVVAREWR